MKSRIIAVVASITVALGAAACGDEVVNGYATHTEACNAEGTGTILKGPIKEADETEYYCQAVAGNNDLAVVVEQSVDHKQRGVANSWLADEDNMMDLTRNVEIPRKSAEQLQQDYQESYDDSYSTDGE